MAAQNLMSTDELRSLRSSLNSTDTQNMAPADAQDLASAVRELNDSINKLIALFEEAQDEIVHNYEADRHSVNEKLSEISNQNQKIAEGILAVAEQGEADEGTAQGNYQDINSAANPQEPEMPNLPEAPEFSDQQEPAQPPSQPGEDPWKDQSWDAPQPDFSPLPDDSGGLDQPTQQPAQQQAPAPAPLQQMPPPSSPQPQQPMPGAAAPQQSPEPQQYQEPSNLTGSGPADSMSSEEEDINPNYPHHDAKEFKKPTPPGQQDLPQIPLPPERKGFLSKFKK